ncbi:hypothetical protein C8F01DRAFT_1134739 [Mycena amicta]|nr:hypothetical protein C8F01DRAFT_1134739 [Mycena amicta]
MAHPYSGAAGYIYANEYPYTPVKAQHLDVDAQDHDAESELDAYGVERYHPIHTFSPSATIWSAPDTDTLQTQTITTQFSEDESYPPRARGLALFGGVAPRPRRESQRRLLPLPLSMTLPVGIAHPYNQPDTVDEVASPDNDNDNATDADADAWYDDDSIIAQLGPGDVVRPEPPQRPTRRVSVKSPSSSLSSPMAVPPRANANGRATSAFYSYHGHAYPAEDSRGVLRAGGDGGTAAGANEGGGGGRRTGSRAKAWRRKIQRRVKRALRRLRRFLEGTGSGSGPGY